MSAWYYIGSIALHRTCVISEVLTVVFDYLSQEIDAKLVEQYRGTKAIVIKSARLLKALARGNDSVQKRIYDRMDTLLRIEVVESEIALALKEVW